MRKSVIILSIYIIASITSCSQSKQPKIIGENPLELKNFDFNLNIENFIPKKYYYNGIFEFPFENDFDRTFHISRDTVYLHHDYKENPQNASRIEYRTLGGNIGNGLAKFGEYPFNYIDFAISLDNKIMAIKAYTIYDDKKSKKEEIDNFIERLTKKYGSYSFKDDNFGTEYSWDLDNLLIQYRFKSNKRLPVHISDIEVILTFKK